MAQHTTPSDIERTSMGIIQKELDDMGIIIPEENRAVVRRVIHTTADFDFASTLQFTPGAVKKGMEAVMNGAAIVTDTNMACTGITKPGMKKLGCTAACYIADADVAARAKEENTTRAVASVRKCAETCPSAIYAVGNAPTALFELKSQIEQGKMRPALIIAVPVGFVNVVEAKEEIFAYCTEQGIPCIAAMGRKGGSTIAATICNALIYSATDMLDPAKRGWN